MEQEGEQEGFEGCLSLSGMYGIVKRPMKVKVQAQDRHGNPVEYEREASPPAASAMRSSIWTAICSWSTRTI